MIFNYVLDISILRLGESGSYLEFLKWEVTLLRVSTQVLVYFYKLWSQWLFYCWSLNSIIFISLVSDSAGIPYDPWQCCPRAKRVSPDEMPVTSWWRKGLSKTQGGRLLPGPVVVGSPYVAWMLGISGGGDSPFHGDLLYYPFTPQHSHRWPSPRGCWVPRSEITFFTPTFQALLKLGFLFCC